MEAINVETIRTLQRLGLRRKKNNYFQKLVDLFISQSNGILEDLELALVAREHSRLKSLVHKLKGSSQTMGAVSLEHHCATLQKALEQPSIDFKQITFHCEQIRTSYDATCVLLNEHS